MVNNNAGNGDHGLAALIREGRVRKIICSFPRQSDSLALRREVPRRRDRARAGAAGQPRRADPRRRRRDRRASSRPTGYGTPLAEGKETREIDGADYVLEYPIHGDVALVSAHAADELGNLVYRKTARNFGPIMAAAATTTVVQVHELRPGRRHRPGARRDPVHLRRPGRPSRATPRPSARRRQ